MRTANRHSSGAVANQILTERFDTVMPLLKELYRGLRPHADWMELEFNFGKVRGSLNFTVADGYKDRTVAGLTPVVHSPV